MVLQVDAVGQVNMVPEMVAEGESNRSSLIFAKVTVNGPGHDQENLLVTRF